MNAISIPLYTTFTPIVVFPCTVPRPHYSARKIRIGSRRSEFSGRSPRIRHRSELTEKAWENGIQGLGKVFPTTSVAWLF